MSSPSLTAGPLAGFPLSLTEAARVLKLTPDAVVDLVRTHCLGAYLAAAHETTERPALRFHPDALPTLAAALASPDSPISDTHTVATGLRAYLAERTPTGDYTEAIDQQRPVLARARSRQIYAHVQAEVLQQFLLDRVPTGQGRKQVRLHLASSTTSVLRRLGCTRVRGIRPLDAERQVWGVWWRVPRSIWSLEGTETTRVDDFAAFGGAREPGERLDVDADGSYLPGLRDENQPDPSE